MYTNDEKNKRRKKKDYRSDIYRRYRHIIGRLRKSGGHKIDLISLLLNKFA